jgi:hypothetical protein
MISLQHGMRDLRRAVPDAAGGAASVSAWSIGMHVHHCGLVMTAVTRALIASTPPEPRSRPSLLARAIFATGRIPRGRGRAPQAVIPERDAPSATLVELLDESERLLTQAASLDSPAWFKHFVFGPLDRDKTIRFIRMHNQHHLRIIDDIRSTVP